MPSNRKERRSSRTHATPAPADLYAPNVWGSGNIGGMEDLIVPSGQLCQVRRPGMAGLLKAGILQNVDSLSRIVGDKINNGGREPSEEEKKSFAKVLEDPAALDEVSYVVDKIVEYCVVQPALFRPPNDVTLRQPGVIYTDMVDLVDKMFIFNFVVGGTRDLERFRLELGESLGSLEDVSGVSDGSE